MAGQCPSHHPGTNHRWERGTVELVSQPQQGHDIDVVQILPYLDLAAQALEGVIFRT